MVLIGIGTMPALMAPRNITGKSTRVEQAQHDALFRLEAEPAQRVAGAIDPLRQFAIGEGAAIVAEGDFAGAAGREIALDQIGGGIIAPGQRDGGRRFGGH